MSGGSPRLSKAVLPAVLLVLVLAATAWIYWPGIAGPALMDDRSSVFALRELREQPELAADYVRADTSGALGRPVAIASFALEQLYLDSSMATAKRDNILLHLANGGLLAWLFCLLLRHAGTPAYQWLAVLAAAAWLLSPLYVSTVLYTVQRMAMLASFFMLLASISYVYFRLALMAGKYAVVPLVLVPVFFMLALFSKENALVLAPLLLLLEWLWFGFRGSAGAPSPLFRSLCFGLMLAGAVAAVFYLGSHFDSVQASYALRDFSLTDRLLSESRFLWHYLAQLYWPDVSGMGLYHDDVVISRSLFEPGSTLYAAAGWVLVLLAVAFLWRWSWGRQLGFAVAVFLVGHSVESTILPLELYFEHRNYFPGIGLFLVLALLIGLLLRRWPETQTPLLAWSGVYILVLAMQLSSQVQIWSNSSLLRLNHITAHPNSYRANLDMATELAEVGALPAALEYSAAAHRLSSWELPGDRWLRDAALSCFANQPLLDDDRAGLAAGGGPLFNSVVTLEILVQRLQADSCPAFDTLGFSNQMAALVLTPRRAPELPAPAYLVLAVMENHLARYHYAYRYLQPYLQQRPEDPRGLLMQMHFALALNKQPEAQGLKTRLQALAAAGKLSVADRQTLALYQEKD